MSFSVNLEAIGVNMPKTENTQVHSLTLGPIKLTPRTIGSVILTTSHSLVSPVDATTGKRRRNREHEALVVTKVTCVASSLFGYHSVATELIIPKLKLNFGQTNFKGTTEPTFTIELSDASIVKYVRKPPPLGSRGPHSTDTHELEEISLVFHKISWAQTGN